MESDLFGSSGIRAVVNLDLTPDIVVKLGLAIATSSRSRRALVGRDTRVSGPLIESALVAALMAGGSHVERLGVVPTPVLAYLTGIMDVDVGVMITASHNPPQFNGVKIFNNDGVAYGRERQKEIENIIETGGFQLADWRSIGEDSALNHSHLYTEMIERTLRLYKEWRIVIDPGCGATYSLAPSLLKNLGCKVVPVNAQPDGFFPSRSIEPNARSLISLGKIVDGLGADIGIGFDGDGDRVAFVDNEGRFVNSDRVLAAYAGYVIKERGSGVVVTNVEASMCVEKAVEAVGGSVVRTKVGDVYIMETMKSQSAVFGGEPCGAWIHPQRHYCPDGILSAAFLLKALEDEGVSLAEFVAQVPEYPILREKVGCANEIKHRVMERFEKSMKDVFPRFQHVSKIDGYRLELDDGWILVRPSGTEPLIRLTVEGESFKAAEKIMDKGLTSVRSLVEEVK